MFVINLLLTLRLRPSIHWVLCILWSQFFYVTHEDNGSRCTGQHDALYFSSTIGQDVMAYDISKNTWHWLPEAPRIVEDIRGPWWMPLPFEPSLSCLGPLDIESERIKGLFMR